MKGKILESGIIERVGRIGEPTEYAEYDRNDTSRIKYVAQKSGDCWNVFKVWPGKKGRVVTLRTFSPTDGKADFIQSAAQNYAKSACEAGE